VPAGGRRPGWRFTVLIPAGWRPRRLPDKPLADIAGKLPMVVRVAERAARQSCAARWWWPADNDRIVAACLRAWRAALLTRADHASGSDRLAEACELLGLDGDDLRGQRAGRRAADRPELVRRAPQLLRERSPTA
jgi:3-deoxy-manno-octulosonate cytidylyltransferase (CMP-KDO synthetase)